MWSCRDGQLPLQRFGIQTLLQSRAELNGE